MTRRDYQELVLADFDHKLAAGLLRPELVSRTRRSLKALSVDVCAERFDPKDELLLRSWFGEKEDAAAYMKAIQKSSADVFRTLHKFLNDRKINTDFNNINLLAWLIDFKPRPYHPNLVVPVRSDIPAPRPQNEMDIPGEPHPPKGKNSTTAENGGNITVSGKELKPRINKKIMTYTLLLLTVCLTGYFIMNQGRRPTYRPGCMVWGGDQYQPVDCREKRGSLPILKLDSQKMAHFRRVNADTLNLRALGYVWYGKFNGRIEFYNDSGPLPADTNRRLLPLTTGILKTHVFHVRNSR